jgi:hypothetical protein
MGVDMLHFPLRVELGYLCTLQSYDGVRFLPYQKAGELLHYPKRRFLCEELGWLYLVEYEIRRNVVSPNREVFISAHHDNGNVSRVSTVGV